MSIQKVFHRSKHKASAKKASALALSICPTGGAGWCPYPFSPAQLAKRLKHKIESMQAIKAEMEVSLRK